MERKKKKFKIVVTYQNARLLMGNCWLGFGLKAQVKIDEILKI